MQKGLAGLFSLGLAGAILFSFLNAITLHYSSLPPPVYGWEWYASPIWGFIAFLLVGLGMWLIISDIKQQTKMSPSEKSNPQTQE